MDARDLFLDQHAVMHSAAVGGNKMSAAERTFAGLTDAQMRVRPREDLNSLAWLMWHIARAVGDFKPQDWDGAVSAETVQRAAADGAFGTRTEALSKAFPGRPRTLVLSGIALFHSAGHMGEATTVRTAGGFGTGI
jgi:DinB superfamily